MVEAGRRRGGKGRKRGGSNAEARHFKVEEAWRRSAGRAQEQSQQHWHGQQQQMEALLDSSSHSRDSSSRDRDGSRWALARLHSGKEHATATRAANRRYYYWCQNY